MNLNKLKKKKWKKEKNYYYNKNSKKKEKFVDCVEVRERNIKKDFQFVLTYRGKSWGKLYYLFLNGCNPR